MKKVKFQTLGCKVNQYETQGMREKLLGSGFEETQNDADCDLFILNTCTVTSEADRKNRYLIRKMHRRNPQAKIIVTGCYAERNQNEISEIQGVTEILGQNQKDRILERALLCFDINEEDFSLCRGQEDSRQARKRFSNFKISEFKGHGRAFVKVQDGCNHACSFCKVVLVRGKSRSRSFKEVIDEVKRLADSGFSEVVLTGIQLGAYGDDLKPSLKLSDLVKELLEIKNLHRLRLSSIEPTDVSDDLIELMRQSNKFCPHLHIPLQSGDSQVLKRMRRRYTSDYYRDLVMDIQRKIPNFALTCDVMCGFPGESDDEFQNTLKLLDELGPLKIHAFPFSLREGTLANRLEGKIPEEVMKNRMYELTEAGRRWQKGYLQRYIGKQADVLVEEKIWAADENRWMLRGRTSNYILAESSDVKADIRDTVSVRIDKNLGDRVFGEVAV